MENIKLDELQGTLAGISAKRPYYISNERKIGDMVINDTMDSFVPEKSYIVVPTGKKVDNGAGKLVPETTVVESHNAAALRHEEWKQIDDTLLEVNQLGTPFVDYLTRVGLATPLANAMGTLELSYEVMSDAHGGTLSMDGNVKSDDDALLFDMRTMPIPMFTKDWTIGQRQLMASRRKGTGLDVTMLRTFSTKLKQDIEDLFVNGQFSNNGNTLYGLTKYPQRNVYGSGVVKWTDPAKTGADIFKDLKAMKKLLRGDKFRGVIFDVIVNEDYADVLDNDYVVDNNAMTIRDRLRKIEGLGEIITCPSLGANQVVMLVRSKDVIEKLNGMPMTVIDLNEPNPATNKFRIQEITLPRIKHDYDGNCGIVHATFTADSST
jgi:hypothetical protein